MDGAVTFADWLHKLPASQVMVLRAFRRVAKQEYGGDMTIALASDRLSELFAEFDSPGMPFSANEAARIVKQMPREFVLAIDH